MNVETVLKDAANAYMAATLAKRVTADVVNKIPYASLGAIALAGAVAGWFLGRQLRSASGPRRSIR